MTMVTTISAASNLTCWVRSEEGFTACLPSLSGTLPHVEAVRVNGASRWVLPLGFSAELEPVLGGFLEALLVEDKGNPLPLQERRGQLVERLRCFLADTPFRDTRTTQLVLLELARQSGLMLSGELAQAQLRVPLQRLALFPSVEQGGKRRSVIREVLNAFDAAFSLCQGLRLGMARPNLYAALQSCPLVLSHSHARHAALLDMKMVGAELDIAVDGQLLEEVHVAIALAAKKMCASGELVLDASLQEELGQAPQSALLCSRQFGQVLSRLQSLLRVRDLVQGGVDKKRAKTLLSMKSTTALFGVMKQVHTSLRQYDCLRALVNCVLPVWLTSGGAFCGEGALERKVRWSFLRPRLQANPVCLSVVIIEVGDLESAVFQRSGREPGSRVPHALWDFWSDWASRAESVGGLAVRRGEHWVFAFLSEDEAEEFAGAIRKRCHPPFSLPVLEGEPALVFPGMEIDIELKRGFVHGACIGDTVGLWGAVLRRAPMALSRPKSSGLSILTETFTPEDSIESTGGAADTFIDSDFQLVDGGNSFGEDTGSTLDAFFLPPGEEVEDDWRFEGHAELGLSSEDVKSILKKYVCYEESPATWVFGVLSEGELKDRHSYADVQSQLHAYCLFVLDKHKEAFAPRTELFGPMPAAILPEPLDLELLQKAVLQVTGDEV